MDSYVIGNLIGRLLGAYLIVWVVCLLASRFDFRRAFKRTHGWVGIPAVLVLFVAVLAITTMQV